MVFAQTGAGLAEALGVRREFLEVRRKAVAERRAVDRQLAERERATAKEDEQLSSLFYGPTCCCSSISSILRMASPGVMRLATTSFQS